MDTTKVGSVELGVLLEGVMGEPHDASDLPKDSLHVGVGGVHQTLEHIKCCRHSDPLVRCLRRRQSIESRWIRPQAPLPCAECKQVKVEDDADEREDGNAKMK